MYEINYEQMGQRMLQRRKELGFTQEKVAEKSNIGPSYYGQIERGEKTCSLTTIVNIAIAMEMNLDTLIRGVDEKNINTAFLEILDIVPKGEKQRFVRICENVANGLKW